MWICTKYGFYSIVDNAKKQGCLLVRARRPGDLEAIFPDSKVVKTIGRDYLFRAEIPRQEVAQKFFDLLMVHDADNFKASVTDNQLHDAYMRIWRVTADMQPIPPYSTAPNGRNGKQRDLF